MLELSQGTIFKNAVLTSTSFVGANVEDADFTEVRKGFKRNAQEQRITDSRLGRSLLSYRIEFMFV